MSAKNDDTRIQPANGASPSTAEGAPEPDSLDHPPPGVRVAAIVRWGLVLAMALVAGLSALSYVGALDGSSQGSGETYYCPMHPQIVSDHPGTCPICSMDLVPKPPDVPTTPSASMQPKAAAAQGTEHAGHRHEPTDPYACPMHPEETGADVNARCPICGMRLEPRAPSATPSSMPASSPSIGVPGLAPITLTYDRVQLVGMKTAKAARAPMGSTLATVGVVSFDEAKLSAVTARASGYVEELLVDKEGQPVKRGQVLARIYSPEILTAQQELLNAARWADGGDGGVLPHGLAPGLVDDARGRLLLLGIADEEIDDVLKSGAPRRTLPLRAPHDGILLRRGVLHGSAVGQGQEVFLLGDLSRVWLIVDLPASAAGVERGAKARATFRGAAGDAVEGTIEFVYPTIDAQSRTVKARVVLDNKDGRLRPGMFADVSISLPHRTAVVIPREALVDTGDHQYVFVDEGTGTFTPRSVVVGRRSGDVVEVSSGIAEGETVVTTGNFLLDSESRLRAAIAGGG